MPRNHPIAARALLLSLATGALLLLGTAFAAPQKAAKAEFAGDPYLLEIDPVTRKKLGEIETQKIVEYEGRELRFASAENLEAFKKDPKKYLAFVDEKMIEQQLPFYPLETCPVSGQKLGGMGKPVDRIYQNRLVRFCCAGCLKSFEKEMGKHLAALDAAVVKAQAPKYRATKCPITGKALDSMGGPYDVVLGNRLVRLCCKGCVKRLRKDPLASFAKIEVKRGTGF